MAGENNLCDGPFLDGQEKLKGLESKLFKKYSSLVDSTGSSAVESGNGSGVTIDPVDDEMNVANPRGCSSSDIANANIQICGECIGVGKIYRNHCLNGDSGLIRVLESCCPNCNGSGYVVQNVNGGVEAERATAFLASITSAKRVNADDGSQQEADDLNSYGPCPFLQKKSTLKTSANSSTSNFQ